MQRESLPNDAREWYSGASNFSELGEDSVKKSIMILALGAMALVAGCNSSSSKEPGIPVGPKWKGPAYRLTFDTAAAKANPAGVALPNVKFTANPDALEHRVTLVVKYDSSEVKSDNLILNQVILSPFDISGTEGKLSADTIDIADKGLAHLLNAYCMKSKVKVSVALARSSLNSMADDAEIQNKVISDWATVEIPYKNLKKGCKM